jgi:YgiT-type zinc finger domain-containing protein
MNTCPYCVGKMERKSSMEFEAYRPGHVLVVARLSGYECKGCGEKFFDEESVGAIEKAVDKTENLPSVYERTLSRNREEMILRIPRELQESMRLEKGAEVSITPVDRNRFVVSRGASLN